MEAILSVNQVSKVIKGHKLLDAVNLVISEPGVYGVIGRNGSGKSVLFKTIIGLMRPTEGEIILYGRRMNSGEFPEELGALLDTPGFVPHYSGFKNLRLLASIRNQIGEQEIRDVIAFVGLDPDNKTPVKKYSLGMKQRLGIAQAIMEKPKFLILDEPMNGLDASGVEDIRRFILELKKQGITILLASHNAEDIALLCDEVYQMDNGRLAVMSLQIRA